MDEGDKAQSLEDEMLEYGGDEFIHPEAKVIKWVVVEEGHPAWGSSFGSRIMGVVCAASSHSEETLMVRTEESGRFRVVDAEGTTHTVVELTEYAVMHGYGGQETLSAGKTYLRTTAGHGVNNNGGGLYSIPALGVAEATLIDPE